MNTVFHQCDVLVLGGGGAAVSAAVKAAQCGADVIVVSKEPIGYGDTRISMGMIANPHMVASDSDERFFEDLLSCGEQINNPVLADLVVKKAARGREFLEENGHLFQRGSTGKIDKEVAFFSGGHSVPRTLGCPPSKGVGIGNALREAVLKSSKIKVYEEIIAYTLLKTGDRVTGAFCYCMTDGTFMQINSKTTIIACGGAGYLYYPHSDCTAGTTGDSYSLAYNVGAEFVDMEQVQFVPFSITHPSSMIGVFIGDPVLAAPNGKLINKNGEIVLHCGTSFTRAEVARLITTQVEAGLGTEYGGLKLDLSENRNVDQDALWIRRKNLGQLDLVKQAYGKAAFQWQEPWDVGITAHYNMGGIVVNEYSCSAVPGLYAAGQAIGGVFGADRLGSVSLSEIFVFGEEAGRNAAYDALNMPYPINEPYEYYPFSFGSVGSHKPIALKKALQNIMWKYVGPARTEISLIKAIYEIGLLKVQACDLSISAEPIYNRDMVDAIELHHMLVSAEIIARSALDRRESRGAHLRLDFPEKNDTEYLGNVYATMDESGSVKTVLRKLR